MIHAVALGEQQAPLIIFLHGFPQFWYSWKDQMLKFSKRGYRCVAIDMRGYGDSEKPAGVKNYALSILAADVEGVIQALGYKKAAAVVAHDWGAMVAYGFAAKYPNSLEKLIILNGPHPQVFKSRILTYPQVLHSSYVFFFHLPFLPVLAFWQTDYAIMDRVFAGGKGRLAVTPEDLELYKYAISRPGALTSAINYYRSVGTSSLSWMSKITTPTLLLWGDKDRFLSPSSNSGLEKRVETLTVKIIEGCSHWICSEKPDEVNQHIVEFLLA